MSKVKQNPEMSPNLFLYSVFTPPTSPSQLSALVLLFLLLIQFQGLPYAIPSIPFHGQVLWSMRQEERWDRVNDGQYK